MDTPEASPEVTGTIKVYSRKDIRKACDDLIRVVKLFGFQERDYFALRLSLDEALINAVVHGNKEDPSRVAFVEYAVHFDRVELTVTDQGEGFDHGNVESCTDPKNIMRPGGRGVCLIRKYMDKAEYNERGNSLHMVRRRSTDEEVSR